MKATKAKPTPFQEVMLEMYLADAKHLQYALHAMSFIWSSRGMSDGDLEQREASDNAAERVRKALNEGGQEARDLIINAITLIRFTQGEILHCVDEILGEGSYGEIASKADRAVSDVVTKRRKRAMVEFEKEGGKVDETVIH